MMRFSIKVLLPLLVLSLGFGQNVFGQPSNYNWQTEFNSWNSSPMAVNYPVNGIISLTKKADSGDDEFNIHTSDWNNKWQNTSTPFNEEYTIYHGGGGSPNSKLLSNTTAGHHYTLQIDGLAYSNRDAVLMETTNAPQSFAATNPVMPADPSIAPGQDLHLTATFAGNKSPEEKAFVRYTKDGFATSQVAEVTFPSNTASSGTAIIPGTFNTAAANVYFYAYTTTVSATGSSNHDLIMLKLANNGGSNYHYTVKSEWKSISSGNWNNPNTWETNAVPADRQKVLISDGTTVTITNDTVNAGPIVVENGGSLVGNPGTTLAFPGGGYTESYGGILKPYNVVVGDNSNGSFSLYINDDLEIQNNLTILKSGTLMPGGGKTPTITMSGMNGNIRNEGHLECNPYLGNTQGEKLKFKFSGLTVLRSNGGKGGQRTRFSDIVIPSGGSLTSDAAGTLFAELQFGTMVCDGTLNMGQTSTGVVDFTVRGSEGNWYHLKSSNPGQVFQFHKLIIGHASTNDVTLGLADGSKSVEMKISGDFEDYDTFNAANETEKIKTTFNGAGTEQLVKGLMGQTAGNHITFSDFEIDNSEGSVVFKTDNGGEDALSNTDIIITGELKLTNGRLVTFDQSVPARHSLILVGNSTISYIGAQSSPTTPCYIEGPVSRKTITGNNQTLSFPVGQGNDYRLLKIKTDASAGNTFTVEHFHYSPEDFTGMTLEYPILNISDVRFWNIKSTDPNNISNTQISIDYGDIVTDGVDSESDLRIVWAEQDASTDGNPNNNTWKNLGPSVGGGSGTITSNVFSMNTLTDKIDITLGNVSLGVNPLPITWLYFEGQYTPSGNMLEWATGSETNNAYFEIERSTDARKFKAIGKVYSAGDSKSKQVYHFNDTELRPSLYYYRIKQVGRDGKSENSRIISLSYTANAQVYPNPFREKLIINEPAAQSDGILRIRDASGKLVLEQKFSKGTFVVNTTALVPGFYTGELIVQNNQPKVFKLVKAR